jgi:hypothetical protein
VIPVRGEITDTAFYGFTVKKELIIDTTAEAVYYHFVSDIGKWWDPEHTYSGNAANLSIRSLPMACFCEKLPGGGFVSQLQIYAALVDQVLGRQWERLKSYIEILPGQRDAEGR